MADGTVDDQLGVQDITGDSRGGPTLPEGVVLLTRKGAHGAAQKPIRGVNDGPADVSELPCALRRNNVGGGGARKGRVVIDHALDVAARWFSIQERVEKDHIEISRDVGEPESADRRVTKRASSSTMRATGSPFSTIRS